MKKTAWKDNNMLLRESTPVEQRDNLAKWQKEYDREEAMDMESKKDRKVAGLVQEIETMCKQLEKESTHFTHYWCNQYVGEENVPYVVREYFLDGSEAGELSLINVAFLISMSQVTLGQFIDEFVNENGGYTEEELEGFDADARLIDIVGPGLHLMFHYDGKLDRAKAGKMKGLSNLWKRMFNGKDSDRNGNWADSYFEESETEFHANFSYCIGNLKGLQKLHEEIAKLIANFNKIPRTM